MADASFSNFRLPSVKSIFRSGDLSDKTLKQLSSIYGTLVIGGLFTVLGTLLQRDFGIINFNSTFGIIFIIAAIFLCLITFNVVYPYKPDASGYDFNAVKRMSIFYLFTFLYGVMLWPLFSRAVEIDPSIIPIALLGAVVVFCSFSIGAILAKRRSFLFLYGIVGPIVMFMGITELLNIFVFSSQVIFQANLYLGLIIFSLYVIMDTQLIIENLENGSHDLIGSAMRLYLDFIVILVRLIIIMMQQKEKSRRQANDNQ